MGVDVVLYVNQMLENAVHNGASDIHVEPYRDRLRIRQRVDGYLLEWDQLDRTFEPALISRIKVMGNLDIGERRQPQDGAMSIEIAGKQLEVRLSTIPVLHGEKIVLRLLYQQKEFPALEELGMSQEQIAQVKRFFHQSGLLIVTGPTGSGKTTTLYALLDKLNHPSLNLVTLEDPIELQIFGINQIQVGQKNGLTFQRGLRAVLRQDPNVIMIGEIRDRETAEIAINAALTGHLVMTTLHTQDSVSAVTRLLDMGIAPYLVSAACIGVIAQRLVRIFCEECDGTGCETCHYLGYRGRQGVFEILEMNEHLRQMVLQNTSLDRLRAYLRQGAKIEQLSDRLHQLVEQKITSLEEAYRVLPYEKESNPLV